MTSIAIIGAGIGGLTLGYLLDEAGYDVTIYEQAHQFARVGAGIQLTPNSTRIFKRLGLEERIRGIAYEPAIALNKVAETGEVSFELEIGKAIEERYGSPYLFMHRADLHEALESKSSKLVQLDKKLVGLEQDETGVTISFADGTRASADYLIGADGVHSQVRELLFGPEEPRFTGRVAYRTTFPASLLGDKQIAEARTKWWGEDRHIVIYYITANRDEVYFVTSQPEDADWMTPESWSSKGDVEELRKAFAHFHPEVRHVLDVCPEVYKWALLERDALPRWSDRRAVIFGDAAHPMTPYMAQGAASALEDAAVLFRCIEEVGLGADGEAFKVFEKTRKERTTKIQQTSSNNQWMRTKTDPTWVYGYDAWTVPLAK
mgnify:CR=1 FL=1